MKFIEDVVSGRLILGNYAKLAVDRHLADLKNNDWEYVFSEEKATGLSPLFLHCATPRASLPGSGLTSNLSKSFL